MNVARVDWVSAPAGPLRGELRVPGDKSISHRAVMLAALAEGTSRISGFLEGEDTLATARAFAAMGVEIQTPSMSERVVRGVGLHGLRAPAQAIDCGNAGTGMRLLTGLLAGQQFDTTLIGDESLSRRPMRRVVDPLTRMGARIDAEPGGMPPLRIHGNRVLNGIEYATPVASAQIKSAILLAGLYALGQTIVREPHATRDYTERMLRAFGWPVDFSAGVARLEGGHSLRAIDVVVPADFSSAAFFLVAAALAPRSELLIESVGMNPRRTGLLAALRLMGADISEERPREFGGERVADLFVRHAPLRGIDVPEELAPDMIDEFPALFIAAATASGTTPDSRRGRIAREGIRSHRGHGPRPARARRAHRGNAGWCGCRRRRACRRRSRLGRRPSLLDEFCNCRFARAGAGTHSRLRQRGHLVSWIRRSCPALRFRTVLRKGS